MIRSCILLTSSRYPTASLGFSIMNSCQLSSLYDVMCKNGSVLSLAPPQLPFEVEFDEPVSQVNITTHEEYWLNFKFVQKRLYFIFNSPLKLIYTNLSRRRRSTRQLGIFVLTSKSVLSSQVGFIVQER